MSEELKARALDALEQQGCFDNGPTEWVNTNDVIPAMLSFASSAAGQREGLVECIAAYQGPVVSFDVAEPYYLASCDVCGWVGSSEACGTDSGWDDSDVHCPRCYTPGADCGKVAERIASPSAPEERRDEVDAGWLAQQLEQWPTRVHPERTIDVQTLMRLAAPYVRNAFIAGKDVDPDAANYVDIVELFDALPANVTIAYRDDEHQVFRTSDGFVLGRGATMRDAFVAALTPVHPTQKD